MARGKRSKDLTDAARRDIVIYFATFHTVDEVRTMLLQRHKLTAEDVAASTLSNYNANNPGGRTAISKKWLTLFDETRERYYQEIAAIPIAQQARRLWITNQLVDALLAKAVNERGTVNLPVVQEIRSQQEYVAKERGGAYTNVRVLEMEARSNLARLLGCDPDELPDDDGAES